VRDRDRGENREQRREYRGAVVDLPDPVDLSGTTGRAAATPEANRHSPLSVVGSSSGSTSSLNRATS
jgi:hypothetical protein